MSNLGQTSDRAMAIHENLVIMERKEEKQKMTVNYESVASIKLKVAAPAIFLTQE